MLRVTPNANKATRQKGGRGLAADDASMGKTGSRKQESATKKRRPEIE